MLNKQMQMKLDDQRSFLPEPQDIDRWSNHKKLLFDPADRSSSKLAREINRRTARKGE